MEITYNGTFTFTDEQKSKLEAFIKNACANDGYEYSAEITMYIETEQVEIKIYPPEYEHYVIFHIFDLNNMGEILGLNFKFCTLFHGGLELIFMK